MTGTRLLRELALPFTETAVLLSMLMLFAVAELVSAVAMVFLQYLFPLGVLIGLLSAVVVLPVCARYLMEILNARICGRAPPPLSVGLFSRYGVLWSVMPLTLMTGCGWLVWRIAASLGEGFALATAVSLLLLVPASLALLAMTGSPPSSLNPVSIYRLIRMSGPDYFLVPAVIGVGGGLLVSIASVPRLIVEFGITYVVFLAFSLTGRVVADSGARQHVGIPVPVMPDESRLVASEERSRRRVLDHAYGLCSRGNGDGGLKHIETFIDQSPHLSSKIEVFEWFFQRMLGWEQTGPALAFGQRFLSRLVRAGETALAMKVTSRCLLEDERFRPLSQDRQRVIDMAIAAGREDIARQLR